jgi:hypothetical protein
LIAQSLEASALRLGFQLAQVQTDQDALGVRQIPDDFADWYGQRTHQGGNSDNLVIPSQGRLLEKVDDFDFAFRFEVLRTDFF